MAEMCHAKAARLYLSNGDDSALTLSAAVPENGNGSAAKVELRGSVRKSLSRPLHVQRAQQSRLVMEPSWPRSYTSIWSVPIQRQGVLAGLMQFGFDQHQEWLPRELQLFTAAAERCLLAADRARLIQNLAARELQVRELAEHMLHVEEMERRRISRELHDEAGQSLVCIRLQLELAEGDLPPELTEVRVKLGEVRDLTEKTILDIRRLISDLSPAVLEQLGLGAAVRQLVNRFQKSYPCVVRLNVGTLTDVPQKIQIVTYRLVQECCNNIAKHSAATNVNISLVSADGLLKLSVQDNGVGFEVQEAFAKHKSFGLSGMRERVALLGGRFEVRSDPAGGRKQHRGTEISIDLPIPA
jgi:signal transduction histidine kinase